MYLIINGRVVTCDSKNTVMEHGAVAVMDKVIVEVGDESDLRRKYPQTELVDAHGGLIMPGLINTHNHIYSALARGMAVRGYAPRSFADILEGLWWRMDRQLTNDDTRISARLTALDCIKNGVTTIFDHHASYGQIEGSLFAIAEEMRGAGLRSCLCYELSDRDGEEKAAAALRENLDFINYTARQTDDTLAAMCGLHASFTLSDETLEKCRFAVPDGCGFHIHVAEGCEDVRDCQDKYQMRVVQRLHRRGVLGAQTIAVHCVHIDESEMDLLAATDTMVVHNPESNMGNAVGCPSTLAQLANDILVGLGTDGYTNDMMESYKVANLLHKHYLQNPTVAWAEIPQMLFVNNAAIAARFFRTPLGVLAKGAAADIIICDYQPITPLTSDNLYSHLLFGLNGRNVVTTIAGGRVLMRDRVVQNMDEERIAAQARENAAALWSRINA